MRKKMASYQSRQRDPLLDSNMQAALERRGKELLGLALVVLGTAAAMLVLSYSPDDPSFLAATDAPVQNWLGRYGALIAAPVFMILGWASVGVGVGLLAWGLRLVLHRVPERVLTRVIFAPIAVALLAVHASTLTTGPGWAHSFGLGGLFGDTVLSIALTVLPIPTAWALKLMSGATGLGLLILGAFVLGFTRREVRTLGRCILVGLVLAYTLALRGLGSGARAAVRGGKALYAHGQARRAARHEAPTEASADVGGTSGATVRRAPGADARRYEDFDPIEDAATAPGGLFARLPSLRKRPAEPMPEPELVEETAPGADLPAADDARIRARISDAIRSRKAPAEPVAPMPGADTATAARRQEPRLSQAPTLDTPGADLPPEPPVQIGTEAAPAASRPLTADPLFDTGGLAPAEPRGVVQHPPQKAAQPSAQARAEAQPSLQFEDTAAAYEHPPLSLLTSPEAITRHPLSDEALEENARMLETVLDDYGVKGEIVSVRPGPVVTMYELEPAPGLKASRVIGLADDIARSMSALSARVSTVPGRSVIGIELPNEKREMVAFREILSTRDYGDGNQKLPLALGKDIGGDPIVANLAKMPHLLIAGTTGSGKSVAINTMILSLLYKLSPDECRLIMIDPKMLELSVYDGIPHLLSPVVTDPKKAVVALKWVVAEMEERYRKMSKMGVRNIEGYNGRVADALGKGEMFTRTVQTGFDDETGEPVFETEEMAPEKMPYIVVVVDEMADLMMVAGKEIEACIQRLAQMARASGIHLIMATQRPSVDVITGTIKANFPTRISFQVTSKVDSRTILGEQGAEQLLGMGDMLYMAGGSKITRVHGPFCSDDEVEEVVNYLKAFGPPDYKSGVVEGPADDKEANIDAVLGLGGNTGGEDALYDQAVAIVAKDRKCSTSYIQRKLAIGYNKAARLVEQMEEEGAVSPANHVGKREILVPEPG
jgi:S-DNA-T family DNA segregation ATPase FtsK/SpoIIIE